MPAKRRILIIGVGSIGERHLRCFLATDRVEAAVCELNDAVRDRVVGEYSVPRHFRDWEGALAAGHDGVVIATPAHLHVPMAQRAVAGGMDVLIEKPLSTDLHGVGELRKLADRQVAGVAYVFRHYPMLRAMKSALEAGRFGRPLQLTAVSGQHFPTYRPAYRETYYADPARGGGAVQDALTHLINAGMWLVGPIDRVMADAAHLALEGVMVEDTVHVLARHGGVLASYSLNQHQAPNETSLTVVCEKGTARVELHRNRWRYMEQPASVWNEEAWPRLERDDVFVAQAEAFLDAMDRRSEVVCSLSEGARTLQCSLAIMESIRRAARWQQVSDEGGGA